MEMEGLRLIEVDNLPTVYIDGIATAITCGSNTKVVYFEYRIWCGELVMYPVLHMVRPVDSYEPGLIGKLVTANRDKIVRNLLTAH